MDNLQALAGVVLDEAKSFSKYKQWIYYAIFLLLVLSIYVEGGVLYGATVLVILFELLAWFFTLFGNSKKSLGHELLRANMLSNAFGKSSNIDITYLKQEISEKALKKAQEFYNEGFFSANKELGRKRLCEMIQESSFWTQHLFGKCFRRTVFLSVFLGALTAIAGLIILSLSKSDPNYTIARTVLFFLTLVPLSDEVDKVFSWSRGSKSLSLIDRRLEGIDTTTDDLIFAIFADYSVIIATSPLIPQKVYDKEKNHLNDLWSQRGKA